MQVSAIVVVRPLVACPRMGLKKQRMLQSISLCEQRAGMIFEGKIITALAVIRRV